LAATGDAAVAAGQCPARLSAQIEGEGGDAHVLELDVTDIASIKSASEAA
jgi:NAD(P)-dependent dehydrogenase (short-subunit alcohol dehydrogenase family)